MVRATHRAREKASAPGHGSTAATAPLRPASRTPSAFWSEQGPRRPGRRRYGTTGAVNNRPEHGQWARQRSGKRQGRARGHWRNPVRLRFLVFAVLPGHREPTPILRLRYQGSADHRAIGIYLASSGQYTEAELPASFAPRPAPPEQGVDDTVVLCQVLKLAADGAQPAPGTPPGPQKCKHELPRRDAAVIAR